MAAENVKDTVLDAADAEQMEEFGITFAPVDYFHYRQFRYTNLKDAVAQAKRDRYRSLAIASEGRPGGI
jgi:hypothetical protein